MTTVTTLPAGQLAALDQAISAYRDACQAWAGMTGSADAMRAAEADLRRAGTDAVTGLVTLPVAALHFTDVRADGARMAAVNGSLLGGELWACWKGRSLRHGVEAVTYADGWSEFVQVRAS